MEAAKHGSLHIVVEHLFLRSVIFIWIFGPTSLGLETPLASSQSCYEVFTDESGECPSPCPYHARCGQGHSCIQESACRKLVLLGRVQRIPGVAPHCTTCQMVGCTLCANGMNGEECVECAPDFSLSGAKCVPNSHFSLHTLYLSFAVVFLALICWILFDFLRAAARSITNKDSLVAGIRARFRGKPRKLWLENCPGYDFWQTPMHLHDDDHEKVSGPGLNLFMNWFVLCFAVGVWLSIMAFCFQPAMGADERLQPSCSRQMPVLSWNDTLDFEFKPAEYDTADRRLLWAQMNYWGVLLLSVLFMIFQEHQFGTMQNKTSREPQLRQYCVQLKGFPEDATDKAAIMRFLQQELVDHDLPGDSVVDLSIAYSISPEQQRVIDRAIDEHLREVKEELVICVTALEDPSTSFDEVVVSEDSPSDAGPLWVRILAYLMCGVEFTRQRYLKTPKDGCTSEESSSDGSSAPLGATRTTANSVDDLFQPPSCGGLRSSGTVFVTMRTEPLAVAFASIGECHNRYVSAGTSSSETDESCIFVSPCSADPLLIRWKDFCLEAQKTRYLRIVLAVIALVFVVMLWILIYGVVIQFVMISLGDSNQEQLGIMTLLGLCVSAGNIMLAYAVQIATDYIGFQSEDHMRVAQLFLTVPLVALNCACDIYMTTQPFRADAADDQRWIFRIQHDFRDAMKRYDSNGPGYALRVAAVNSLLVPSYVLVPYIVEPIGTIFLPVMIGIWRIMCDRTISQEKAARILLSPSVEVVNPPYGDMITTTSTILYTLWLFPGSAQRWLFPWYCIFVVVLYIQNRLRILYVHQYTYFGSIALHRAECALWTIPSGILAMCVWREVYPGHATRYLPLGSTGFFTHMLFWFVFIRYIVPSFRPRHCSSIFDYEGAKLNATGHTKFFDYNNVNAVEVLKSLRDTCRFEGPLASNTDIEALCSELVTYLKMCCVDEVSRLDIAKLRVKALDETDFVVTGSPKAITRFRAIVRQQPVVLLGWHVRALEDLARKPLVFYRSSEAYLQPNFSGTFAFEEGYIHRFISAVVFCPNGRAKLAKALKLDVSGDSSDVEDAP